MFRIAVFLIAWFAFLVAAVAVAARYLPVTNHAVLVIAALSPYLVGGAGIAVLPILITPWRWAAVPALALVAVTAAVNAPLFISQPVTQSVPIRVMTANLREGSADPTALAEIASDQADVVVVQELTPELAEKLDRMASDFPYHAIDPRSGASGVGIWSRHPIGRSSRDSGYQLGMVTAALRVPGASADVIVLAAHVAGPWPQPITGWRQEMAALPRTLETVATRAGTGVVIVAGDLNATRDMQPFRRLLTDGYRDAAEQSGAGFTPTFPADSRVPPLIGIDHILTRNGSASAMRTVRIPGTDHLAVVATVHAPG